MGAIRFPSILRLSGAGLACLLLCCTALAQRLPAPSATASGVAAAAAAASNSDTLSGLIDALDARDRLTAESDRAVAGGARLTSAEEQVDALESRFAELARRASGEAVSSAGEQQLVDVDSSLAAAGSALDVQIEWLRKAAQAFEAVVGKLRDESTRWQARAGQLEKDDPKDELPGRIRLLQTDLDTQLQAVRPLRDRSLVLLDRATRLRGSMSTLHEELTVRRARIAASLRNVEQEPLWRLLGNPQWETEALRAERRSQWHATFGYLRDNALRLALVGLAVLIAAGLLLRNARAVLLAEPDSHRPGMRGTLAVLERPYWAALLLAMMAVSLAAPSGGPVAFYDLGWLMVPIPSAILVLRMLGPGMRLIVWTLVVALLMFPFRSQIELDPLADRLKTTLQLLLLIGALAWEVRRGSLPEAFAARVRRGLRVLGLAILAALLAALVANIVGYVGLARTLRNGVLGSLGFALVWLAMYHALHGLGLCLLRTPLARTSGIVRRRGAMLDHALEVGLRLLAIASFAMGVLSSFGLDDAASLAYLRFSESSFRVGEATISVGALLLALLILAGTYVATVVLRILLQDELMPRLRLRRGVALAVSTLAGYTVAIIGLLFALAAAGIDLTKVTLLAGAIGVGVGLGLQGIIANFISGLVLLVERPIHVGDTIETGSVSGTVLHIGARASVIRTAQGADVIVPNGDLLSRQVINWTSRDRQRRIDMVVWSPFDSDPKAISELLVRVATEHAGVKKEPAPQALFVGLGQWGLEFRVLAWLVDIESGSRVDSELRSRVLAQFGELGISPVGYVDIWHRRPAAEGEPRSGA